jgi:hypothetical protein
MEQSRRNRHIAGSIRLKQKENDGLPDAIISPDDATS